MRLKIFSCHHVVPEHVLSTEIFQTIVSGIAAPDGSRIMSDLDGLNIAHDNDFSELRHQYYIWKNKLSEYDYVGFEHYRRPFLIDPFDVPAANALMPPLVQLRRHFHASPAWALVVDDRVLADYVALRAKFTQANISRICQWIGSFDIVAGVADREPIDEQWRACHDASLWPEIVRLTKASPWLAGRECLMDFSLRNIYFRNMYILRAEIFDEYMGFCFDILFRMRDDLGIRSHRLYGYVSERLFSFFLHQKRVENSCLRTLELPVLVGTSSLPKPAA
jgi:hypothetical protein